MSPVTVPTMGSCGSTVITNRPARRGNSGGHDKSKNPVNDHNGRDGNMKRSAIGPLAIVALVSSAELLSTGAPAGVVAFPARTLLAMGDDVSIVHSFPANKGPGWK